MCCSRSKVRSSTSWCSIRTISGRCWCWTASCRRRRPTATSTMKCSRTCRCRCIPRRAACSSSGAATAASRRKRPSTTPSRRSISWRSTRPWSGPAGGTCRTCPAGNNPDPRIRHHYTDGVAFVKNKQGEYDVIIVDSSDPVGPAEQLFSSEFYRDLRNALNEGGLMVCQSQSPIFHQDVMMRS